MLAVVYPVSGEPCYSYHFAKWRSYWTKNDWL